MAVAVVAVAVVFPRPCRPLVTARLWEMVGRTVGFHPNFITGRLDNVESINTERRCDTGGGGDLIRARGNGVDERNRTPDRTSCSLDGFICFNRQVRADIIIDGNTFY